ncbi:hypothetical protein N8I71_19180 [Roseibacterium sp. SDUM158016]|uniref:hypothetical protein n=1 Tax=Roseicyclus sediminis TaxID=2980997 RepID=UPI0021D359D9|nr:hypothetical protein [Roseibacterium sp. SDUM158016]MCU4654968.1 hypothetical protein [Roseibacterium sp. SDUM158016]
MTVLEQYRRLESLGLWREGPEAQRREVVVSLGDATLVVSTPTETALTHWSLPAVERLNPGRSPALYAPGADADERLEIDDPDMIEAIEKVRTAIEKTRPHPGRLRWFLGAGAGLALLAGAVFWLPGALTRQTVSLLPEAKRVEIGDALLSEIGRLAGQPCDGPRSRVALARLSTRTLGPPAPRVVLIPAAIPDTISLPGGLIVASAALAEDHETPEVLAGYLLAEDARSDLTDPMLTLLEDAGLFATFKLLTTGDLPPAVLHDHAVRLLSREAGPVPDDVLVARFAEAELSTQPYAYARDVSGESVLALIEADPMRGRLRSALMSDEDWLSLQNVCVTG